MAFVPTISACLQKNCNYVVVTDTTGVYDVSTNDTGWGDAVETILASAVTALTIAISQGGTTLVTTNVLSQLPDPVTGEIIYSEIEVDGLIDGEFTVTYTVTTASTTYTASETYFQACSVRCCIDSKWSTVASNGDTTTSGNTALVYEALGLEGLYASMNNAAASNYTTIRNNYLTKLQRICNITASSGCGCGTCDGCS